MTHYGQHKEKRLHEGGVRPEMRSPAGLTIMILHVSIPLVSIFSVSTWGLNSEMRSDL